MANNFDKNWTTVNNNYPLNDKEVERYISVKPSDNQPVSYTHLTLPTNSLV